MKTELTNKRSTIGERSAETITLLNALSSTKPGEVLTYSELGSLIKLDDIRMVRHILAGAIRIALKEKHMCFGSVKNVGIQRLDAESTLKTTRSNIKSIHNRTKLTIRKINTVDVSLCNQETQTEVLKQQSVLGTLALFSSNQHMESLPSRQLPKPDFGKVLAQFTKQDLKRRERNRKKVKRSEMERKEKK